MPPCLDIYGLTKRREFELIERFVNAYVDRENCEDRGDEELMMLPLNDPLNASALDLWEWEPAKTLSHAIQRGLDHPRRSFTIYLASRVPGIEQVVIGFTTDDHVVLGLSIDDEGMHPHNQQRAELLLSDLARDFECHLGLIAVEQPPPIHEQLFREAASSSYAVHFAAFGDRDRDSRPN